MVVVMQSEASEEQIQAVIDRLVALGFDIHRSTGASHTVLGAVGVQYQRRLIANRHLVWSYAMEFRPVILESIPAVGAWPQAMGREDGLDGSTDPELAAGVEQEVRYDQGVKARIPGS